MMKMLSEMKLLIGGKFVPGAGESEEVLNPATGDLIARIPSASQEQVDEAVAGATRAFLTWSVTTPGERSGMLLKLADRIEAGAEEFARLESQNCGKPYARVLADEMPAIVDCFRFFAGAARCMNGSAVGEYVAGHTSMIRRDPVGVVASIAPWNYPLLIVAWKIAPALAAGNTVVLKPSEQTPLTALKLANIMAEIFPPGVFSLVLGRGESVGAPLVSHAGVDMISLTGDIATGRKMLQSAAATIKRTHL
ncbi:MAG: aldehyde dehydrogenase family protein, partial [Burkholderiales bacterium]